MKNKTKKPPRMKNGKLKIGTPKQHLKHYADFDYLDKLDDEATAFMEKFVQGYYNNNYKKAKKIGLSTKVTNQINDKAKLDALSIRRFCTEEYDPNLHMKEKVYDPNEEKKEYSEPEMPFCLDCEAPIDDMRIARYYDQYKIKYKCHGQESILNWVTQAELDAGISYDELKNRILKVISFRKVPKDDIDYN